MPDDWLTEVCGVTPEPPLDPGPGLERLSRLVDLAETSKTSQTSVLAIAACLDDAEALDELAVAWRGERQRVTALLMRLGAAPRLQQRTAVLEKIIRERAGEQERLAAEKRLQVVQEGAGGVLVAEVLQESLGAHPLPAALSCPPGWELSPAGIRRVRLDLETGEEQLTPVAHRPLLVEGRYRDIDEHTVTLALGWPTASGRWQSLPAPRSKVADARALVSLASHDAPVNSNNARDLVQFLADFEAANAGVLPEARVSGRMGWHGSAAERCFLWGRNLIQVGGIEHTGAFEAQAPARWEPGRIHLLVDDPGVRGLAEGYRAGGSWAGWVETFEAVLGFPKVVLGVYAALVPPLMGVLPTLSNFIVDWCGETSQGKTTTLRMAASVWGCPDERGAGILYSWDATRVFVERAAALADYLPLFLDDTKRARRPEDVGRTLYDFASGVGRGRGSLRAVQRTTRAHGVLLSTGEAPATSFTNDGGTRARTLCLWGSPFEGTTAATVEAARRVHAGSMAHFGHAGPRLVHWLLQVPQAVELVRGEYEAQLGYWTELSNGNGVASRAAQYVAALAVARRVLHEVLSVPEPAVDPLDYAWESVRAASSDSDRASEALREVMSWATGQQHRFYGRAELEPGRDDPPSGGWLGAWARRDDWKYLAVLPTEMKAFLERQRYDTEAILRLWEERGWLMRDGRHRARKVTVGDRKERCYALSRAACEQIDAE